MADYTISESVLSLDAPQSNPKLPLSLPDLNHAILQPSIAQSLCIPSTSSTAFTAPSKNPAAGNSASENFNPATINICNTDSLHALSRRLLNPLCWYHGLSAGGKNIDIVARLHEHATGCTHVYSGPV